MSLVDTAIAKMQKLPPERSQEVIDFIDIDFLLSREPSERQPDEYLKSVPSTQDTIPVFDAAGDLIGCVAGPSDDYRTHPMSMSTSPINVASGE